MSKVKLQTITILVSLFLTVTGILTIPRFIVERQQRVFLEDIGAGQLKQLHSNLVHMDLSTINMDRTFKAVFAFLYSPDYTSRVLLAQLVPFENIEVVPTVVDYFKDPYVPLVYQYHKEGECSVYNASQVPSNAFVYHIIKDDLQLPVDKVYLISCPLIINDYLVGFVGSIIYKEEKQLSLTYNLQVIRLIAHKVEDELQPYF